MPLPLKTQIRQAAIAAFNAGNISPGNTVRDSFAALLQRDGLQLTVNTANEQARLLSKDPGVPLAKTLILELVATNSDPLSVNADEMDNIEAKACQVLAENYLGDLLEQSFFHIGTTADYSPNGDTVVAKMIVRFQGEYHVKQSDPTTAY